MTHDQSLNSEEKILLQEKYNNVQTASFFADQKRLQQGEPLAYIIGTIPFAHTIILLDSKPLIPRTESEFWIMKALAHIDKVHGNKKLAVLDIFAGSGALGVAWLHHRPHDTVLFAEIDTNHIHTIKKNIALNNINSAHANYTTSDVWNNISGTFDVIIANPPYIPNNRKLSASVIDHEPHQALFADDSGQALIARFIAGVQKHSTGTTHMYLEHDEGQGEYIRKQVRNLSEGNIQTRHDQYGKERYTVAHCI